MLPARSLPVLGTLLLALMAGLFASPVSAQQQQPPNREFSIQNETDLILRELYVTAPGATERGPDRLGADTIAPGANFRVRLGRTRDCLFDVIAIYVDGSEEARRRVDLCRTPRVVFGDPTIPTLDVSVTNRSPVVLRELYAMRAGGGANRTADAWGPDRLGASVIEAGAEFRMRLRSRDCAFDVRAVYADDREEVKERVDLCANRTLVFDRSTLPREPSRTLVLINRHLATVQEIYVSPSTETDWGPDRLGTGTLPAGEEATVTLEGGCEVDVRIVFPNGGAEERREVDLCDTPRIVIRPGWVVAEQLDDGSSAAISGASRLRNAGPLPIVEVYAAPPGAPRGEDRLGADILPIGEFLEIGPPDANACTADLVAVFRDGREVTRAGVDLCSGEEIEVR